jgi:hypothetical protein
LLLHVIVALDAYLSLSCNAAVVAVDDVEAVFKLALVVVVVAAAGVLAIATLSAMNTVSSVSTICSAEHLQYMCISMERAREKERESCTEQQVQRTNTNASARRAVASNQWVELSASPNKPPHHHHQQQYK